MQLVPVVNIAEVERIITARTVVRQEHLLRVIERAAIRFLLSQNCLGWLTNSKTRRLDGDRSITKCFFPV